MKKIPGFVIIILFISCFGLALRLPKPRLDIRNDEFSNSKVVTLEMHAHSHETTRLLGSDIPIFTGKLFFLKDIKSDNIKSSRVTFNVRTDVQKEKLQGDVIFLSGDNKVTYKITSTSAEILTETHVENTSKNDINSTRVQTSTQVRTKSYKNLTGSIILNSEFDKNVKENIPLKIRLYSGDLPITFIIEGENLANLVKFSSL